MTINFEPCVCREFPCSNSLSRNLQTPILQPAQVLAGIASTTTRKQTDDTATSARLSDAYKQTVLGESMDQARGSEEVAGFTESRKGQIVDVIGTVEQSDLFGA